MFKGLPRVEQVAANRRLLLEAALGVFREVGYAAASVDAIAEAAGFTKGAVYSHFSSKADLFLSLLEDRMAERAQHALEITSRRSSRSDGYDFAHQLFADSRADGPWRLAVLEFRVVAARDPELNARYAASHRRAVDAVADALARFIDAAGADSPWPPETLARIAFALDVGSFLEDFAFGGVFSPDSAAAVLCQISGLPMPSRTARARRGA